MQPRLEVTFGMHELLEGCKGILSGSYAETGLDDYFPDSGIFHFNHARSAITLYLKYLNLRPGAIVGVQVLNCITVFQAILNAGCKPRFIDIDETFTLDMDDLKKKCHQLDALIVTHAFGNPADMGLVLDIVGELPVIEDCAHGFLTTLRDRYVGTFGKVGVFSYGLGKFPSVGDGGFLLINRADDFKGFQKVYNNLSKPGIASSSLCLIRNLFTGLIYLPEIYAVLFRFKQKIGSKGVSKMKYKYEFWQGYKHNQRLLSQRLKSVHIALKQRMNNLEYVSTHLPLGVVKAAPGSNGFMCPIMCKDPASIVSILAQKGIEVAGHFQYSLREAGNLGYETGECVNAERIIRQYLTLPVYTDYPQEYLSTICSVINQSEAVDENCN